MALITFDLDGTVQRNPFGTGVFPHVWRLLAPYYCRRHPECTDEEAMRQVAMLVRGEFRRRQEIGEWVAAFDWDDIIAGIGADLGYEGRRIDLVSLVECYCTPEHITVLPGARECLAALRAAGHTLKAATNGFAAYQEPVLAALGLLEFFAAVITPDRCRSAKPRREFFAACGEPPGLHVGDAVVPDVWGAHQAGFATLWYRPQLPPEVTPAVLAAALAERLAEESKWQPMPVPPPEQCRPDYVVRELSAIPAIVAAWSAGR